MSNQVRVVKVGGSLLRTPGLAERLSNWIKSQPPAKTVLITGGGRLADAIREIETAHGMSVTCAHWLCIQLLDVTAQILQELLPDAEPIKCLTGNSKSELPDIGILFVEQFMRSQEPTVAGVRLEAGWQSTSDSIAARVATYLNATELVLLKACELPPNLEYREAARRGLVDAAFPTAARPLTVRWVNLMNNRCN